MFFGGHKKATKDFTPWQLLAENYYILYYYYTPFHIKSQYNCAIIAQLLQAQLEKKKCAIIAQSAIRCNDEPSMHDKRLWITAFYFFDFIQFNYYEQAITAIPKPIANPTYHKSVVIFIPPFKKIATKIINESTTYASYIIFINYNAFKKHCQVKFIYTYAQNKRVNLCIYTKYLNFELFFIKAYCNYLNIEL